MIVFDKSTKRFVDAPYINLNGGPAWFYGDSAEYHKRLASSEFKGKIVCTYDGSEEITLINGVDNLFNELCGHVNGARK
jgi:hypothetical protein